jgi:hypothetical protein
MEHAYVTTTMTARVVYRLALLEEEEEGRGRVNLCLQ